MNLHECNIEIFSVIWRNWVNFEWLLFSPISIGAMHNFINKQTKKTNITVYLVGNFHSGYSSTDSMRKFTHTHTHTAITVMFIFSLNSFTLIQFNWIICHQIYHNKLSFSCCLILCCQLNVVIVCYWNIYWMLYGF